MYVGYFYKKSSVFMHRKFNKIQRKIVTIEKKNEHTKLRKLPSKNVKIIKSNRRKWIEKTTRTNIHMLCNALWLLYTIPTMSLYVSCFFGGDCCFRCCCCSCCCSVKTIVPCLLAFTSINYMVMKWTRGIADW